MKVLIFLTSISLVQGYNILCLQNVPSRSHYNIMYGIVKSLLQAGHEITMVTAFPETKPIENLTFVDVSQTKKALDTINVLDKNTMGMRLIKEFARNVSNIAASSPAVRELLIKTNFDAVVSEWFLTDADAGYAAVQQVPWIVLLGSVMSPYVENLVDNVKSIPTIPVMLIEADIPMTFWQRIKNTLICAAVLIGSLIEKSSIESDYSENFGSIAKARGISLAPLDDAKHNISILFVNSHPSLAPAQSLPPNVIDIAGYHIGDVPPLSKDLQELLDSSTKGFIYFSMGSVVKTNDFTEKTKQDLVNIFKNVPYTVLWKFDEALENPPKNLHVKSWIPQLSVLAHPNIKLFITHGGLLSMIESLRFGVPVLVLPVYADQPSNANQAVRGGYGLRVDFSENMEVELTAAIKEMTSNDSYFKQAKSQSAIFLSRPVSPFKLIQHYVQLAIESKGAYHLRSKSLLYKQFQLLMLDQLLFFLVIIYILSIVVKKVYIQAKHLVCSDKIKND